MELKELHARYGQLMVSLEILQGQIQETKRAIAEEMQKPRKEEKDGAV
jgi:hypothetical protein